MDLIFDIGMFDGSDTSYYLETGHQVVAVEANPQLVKEAQEKFADQIKSGQLTCINAAISSHGNPTELSLSSMDLGSSTLFAEKISNKRPVGSILVPGITLQNLFESYGIPKYLKVDIEGADRYCVLALTTTTRPAYLSFERGNDVEELLTHISKIGYTQFKIINQSSFREYKNVECLYDRIARKIMFYLGYAEPVMVRRSGRFFVTEHSSGPAPWQSDGNWRSFENTLSILKTKELHGWFDIHAKI